jgi:deoxyribose-phosphate aldolase
LTREYRPDQLARLIDHAVLDPAATDDDLTRECELARAFGVAAVCVKPYAVALAERLLRDSSVAVCGVVSFPHGSNATEIKAREAELCMRQGAREIDMVVNIGQVRQHAWNSVTEDIEAVNNVVTTKGGLLKVIFETGLLDDSQITDLCRICSRLNVAFVKTSTGFAVAKQPDGRLTPFGATPHHVRLMREQCISSVQIKASGGIRTLDDLMMFRDLGATRIGTSSTREILEAAGRRL